MQSVQNLHPKQVEESADGQQKMIQMSVGASFWKETEQQPHAADRRGKSG